MEVKIKSTSYIIHKLKEYTLKFIIKGFYKNLGESIFSEEWNHLIILDDCRYDVFEDEFYQRNLPGELKAKLSLGSWTGEFLMKNFTKNKYEDIVFITSNPFVDLYLKNKFYKIISIWKTQWDNKYQTVTPRAVYNVAIKAMKQYPDKRFVIHFLQPHHPYFTLNFKDETMELIKSSILNGKVRMDTVGNEPLNKLYLSPIYGKFHLKRLMWAYRENLRIVLPYVELLLHKLRGKIVVTADHGELFGEPVTRLLPIKVYGHGIGRNQNLIRVPWWTIEDADKDKLRPVKDIKKEIYTIEKKFEFSQNIEKKRWVKKVVSKLKTRKKN